ncbi:Centrosomal_protein [Hexamita inflata]|uniref:Centrosomal protein n=1 Tax=Hexamita inflata TaxID=28002 RepID=A0AA86P8Q7_9EUKA|nr:Centrosomal protein [Hexamita inflata]CAI9961966.1 Centrosomal protein [Hexamita inflata]
MNSDQIQKFLTPDKVQELFQLLNITPETPESVARQRIAQYVQTNQVVSQMYSSQTQSIKQEPLDIKENKIQQYQAENVKTAQRAYGERLDTTSQRQILRVSVQRAEGFVNVDMSGVLSLHIRAGPGRASSKSVQHADCPQFCECFNLELNRTQNLTRLQLFHLLKYSPLQFLIIQRKIDGSSRVYGHAELDFASVFEDYKQNYQIKIKSFGDSEEIVGLLYIALELSPDIQFGSIPDQMKTQQNEKLLVAIQTHKQEQKQIIDQFKYNCQLFQQEFQNAKPGAKQYLALNLLRDDGKIVPSNQLIQPVYSKQLNTSHKCYRFVNLMPDGLDDQVQPIWSRPYTTLARGSGSDEDKAILLCSLLRGLQMPAFVAVGQTHQNTGFVAVIAIYGVKVQLYYREEIYYFKQQPDGTYLLEDHSNNYPESETLQLLDIKRVDSLFNDLDTFANVQQSAQPIILTDNKSLVNISFNLSRPSLWKRFPADILNNLQLRSEIAPVISPFNPETAELCSEALEQKLWQLIAARRSDVGLSTPKSESLSRLLGNALPSYELEQLTGLVVGNEQFQLGVKNYVRDGEYFDAFPMQIAGALRFHAPSVFREIVQNEAGRRIIEQVGDNLRLGLRVYVEGYAETICAVWICVGCCCVPVGK